MKESQQLNRNQIDGLLRSDCVSKLSVPELEAAVRENPGIGEFAPDGDFQVDPRTGDRILYNTARARRPHDNRPAEQLELQPKPCVICDGKTTEVVDVAELSSGFTFVNFNLFPMVFPKETTPIEQSDLLTAELSTEGFPARGLHFLQWTSSEHDLDWNNMPIEDLTIVMNRLGILEEQVLTTGKGSASSNESWGDAPGRYGYVSIIKNYGRLVGGSLAHGHQQICYSSMPARRFVDDYRFEKAHGEVFSQYLLRSNPEALTVREYDTARLVVPYFMKRPYEMMLIVKDTSKRYIHELGSEEQRDLAQGWKDATALTLEIMSRVGREAAYNVISHVGPGAGAYFEFLPYTQETGGYEHLGLYVCQGNAPGAAKDLREIEIA